MKKILSVLAVLLSCGNSQADSSKAEQEVWYGADGEVVVVRPKEVEREVFRASWELESKKKIIQRPRYDRGFRTYHSPYVSRWPQRGYVAHGSYGGYSYGRGYHCYDFVRRPTFNLYLRRR